MVRGCALLLLVSCLYLVSGLGTPTSYPVSLCLKVNQTSCSLAQIEFVSATEYIALMDDGNVFRSADEGQSWTQLQMSNILQIDGFDSDPRSMFFVNGYQYYYTTDGGITINKGSFPVSSNYGVRYITQIVTHHSQDGWIFFVDCNLAVTQCTLTYSKNYGQTWIPAFTPNSLANRNIYWSPRNETADILFANLAGGAFGYTSSYDMSGWTTLFPKSLGSVLTRHFLFVGTPDPVSGISLYASSAHQDRSHTNASLYLEAEFPWGDVFVAEKSYSFLDDYSHSEFIAVTSNSTSNKKTSFGDVFSSDFDGEYYDLSISQVPLDQFGYYDFDRVESLEGVFLANQYNSASDRVSRITFDNGGEWRPLTPPAFYLSGEPVKCDIKKGCSLQLHGLTSYTKGLYPPFYSSDNAIGLILAVGNIDTYLSNLASYASTFLSRDGGLTWTEIFDGATIYEFGDHGGILVLAPYDDTATKYIYYSLDEGLTWSNFSFTPNPVFVSNILTEPSGTGQKFFLYGTDMTGNSIFYGLDFSTLNIPKCSNEDYEIWTPSNGFNASCFMGATTTYLRRKQASQCYNDRDTTDHVLSRTPCLCAYEDYECDYGYVPSARADDDSFTCADPNTGAVANNCGYRLIAETKCQGGLTLVRACSGTSGSGSNVPHQSHVGTAVVVTLLVLFVAAGVAVGVLYWKNDGFRDTVNAKLEALGLRKAQTYSLLNTNQPEVDDLDN